MLGHDKHHYKDMWYYEDFIKLCMKYHIRTKGSVACEWGCGVVRATPALTPYFDLIHLNDIAGNLPKVRHTWDELKETLANNKENKTTARIG